MKKDSDTLTASPGFVSVQTGRPLMKFVFPVMLFAIVAAVMFGRLVGSLVFQMPWLGALLALFVAGIVVLIVVLPWHESRRAKIEAIVSRNFAGNRRAVVQEIALLWAWNAENPTILELPDILAKHGWLGETFQIWWKVEPDPIEPLPETFEPRVLDETAEGFVELADAAEAQCAQAVSSTEGIQTLSTDQSILRRVLRNIRLEGGWIQIVFFSLFSLGGFWEAVQQGEITWLTVLWPSLLVMVMFMPTRKSPFSETQWLLLPGGLLLREPTNRGKDVKLHLFDRRRSVLCVYPIRRATWRLSVADAETSEITTITDRERELLLRAWLSPVEPPPLERLVDLS